jgi:tubulin-specific chaperone A
MEADLTRQLKIKTGVVRRLTKEYHSYETEASKQVEKIQKMREADRDSYDIKK